MHLGAGFVVLTSIGACSRPVGPPDDRRELRVLRPEDLLSLHFELRNLRIESGGWGPARLVRIDDARDALLVVTFPGQHIAEQAFRNATSDPLAAVALPVRSRIAQPTRLVFRMPSNLDFVELTLQSLLAWDLLEQRTADIDANGQSTMPRADRSRIELPVGLALAPDPLAHWTHATRPVENNGRTELWHTRLAPASPGSLSMVDILGAEYAPEVDFETALSGDDRSFLVGKSAQARTLILSPMGGWLDLRGRWEPETAADISRWEHTATAGQDQRVIVERGEGFLYPFGHRATLLSVTEREVQGTPVPDGVHTTRVAVLRKRHFVVIKEPEVSYRSGEMALQTLTAQSLVTPALEVENETADAFWIETSKGMPYPFRFGGKDWAGAQLDLEAPAVFVKATATAATAAGEYGREDYRVHRQAGMRGQSAAVAAFEPRIEAAPDGGDDPAERPRSAGDTTLNLLALVFVGLPVDAGDADRSFRAGTERMLVRIPSLEPFLDEAQNRGWFYLVDPDGEDNRGEVFAMARSSELDPIPMYFDQQADRAGGLAAPSFDVDGLSRIHGPVGNAELVRSGGSLSGGKYFNADHATLLGGFPLVGLLSSTGAGPSPAVPRIDFIIARKQPKEEDEPKTEPEAGDEPEPKPEKPAYWEVGLGLTWTVPLGAFGEGALVSFAPKFDHGKSTSKLEIAVKATKTLGQRQAPAAEKDKASPPERGEASADKPSSGVSLSASGKITNFALVLNVSEQDTFRIGFEHITVKLGPPKPKKKEDKKAPDKSANDSADAKEEGKKKERSISPEVDYRTLRNGRHGRPELREEGA